MADVMAKEHRMDLTARMYSYQMKIASLPPNRTKPTLVYQSRQSLRTLTMLPTGNNLCAAGGSQLNRTQMVIVLGSVRGLRSRVLTDGSHLFEPSLHKTRYTSDNQFYQTATLPDG